MQNYVELCRVMHNYVELCRIMQNFILIFLEQVPVDVAQRGRACCSQIHHVKETIHDFKCKTHHF